MVLEEELELLLLLLELELFLEKLSQLFTSFLMFELGSAVPCRKLLFLGCKLAIYSASEDRLRWRFFAKTLVVMPWFSFSMDVESGTSGRVVAACMVISKAASFAHSLVLHY